ncbi:MAG TPA: hypothetical protein VMT86_08345 [Bryobacteraceae bacterium]|nr:hypothetical protein [Bryobacteraceae bacterium]
MDLQGTRAARSLDGRHTRPQESHLDHARDPQWQNGIGEPGSLSTDTLEQLAGLTGGRALNSDRVQEALAAAATDAASSYTIVYAAQLDRLDGKYHKLRVEIGRRGLRAQTRQGYYADRLLLRSGEPDRR